MASELSTNEQGAAERKTSFIGRSYKKFWFWLAIVAVLSFIVGFISGVTNDGFLAGLYLGFGGALQLSVIITIYFALLYWLPLQVAKAAERKGRNKWTFFVLALFFLVPVAIIVAFLRDIEPGGVRTQGPDPTSVVPQSDSESATKTCPYCGETILLAAKKCKHCAEFLVVE